MEQQVNAQQRLIGSTQSESDALFSPYKYTFVSQIGGLLIKNLRIYIQSRQIIFQIVILFLVSLFYTTLYFIDKKEPDSSTYSIIFLLISIVMARHLAYNYKKDFTSTMMKLQILMGMKPHTYIIGWIIYSLLHGLFLIFLIFLIGVILYLVTELQFSFIGFGVLHQLECLFAVIGFTLMISSLADRYQIISSVIILYLFVAFNFVDEIVTFNTCYRSQANEIIVNILYSINPVVVYQILMALQKGETIGFLWQELYDLKFILPILQGIVFFFIFCLAQYIIRLSKITPKDEVVINPQNRRQSRTQMTDDLTRQSMCINNQILKLTNVSLSFNKRYIFKSIQLSIEQQKIYIVSSKNSYGKSSLLKMICGFQRPTEGFIRYTKNAKLRLGICLEENILYGELTAIQQLKFVQRIKNIQTYNYKHFLRQFQMNEEELQIKKSKHLSGGNQKKICLCMAFLGSPDLIILDDPTIGLDQRTKQSQLLKILQELRSKGSSILISTSEPELFTPITDQILQINDQEIDNQFGNNLLRNSRQATGPTISLKVVSNQIKGYIVKVYPHKSGEVSNILPEQETDFFTQDQKNQIYQTAGQNNNIEKIDEKSSRIVRLYFQQRQFNQCCQFINNITPTFPNVSIETSAIDYNMRQSILVQSRIHLFNENYESQYKKLTQILEVYNPEKTKKIKLFFKQVNVTLQKRYKIFIKDKSNVILLLLTILLTLFLGQFIDSNSFSSKGKTVQKTVGSCQFLQIKKYKNIRVQQSVNISYFFISSLTFWHYLIKDKKYKFKNVARTMGLSFQAQILGNLCFQLFTLVFIPLFLQFCLNPYLIFSFDNGLDEVYFRYFHYYTILYIFFAISFIMISYFFCYFIQDEIKGLNIAFMIITYGMYWLLMEFTKKQDLAKDESITFVTVIEAMMALHSLKAGFLTTQFITDQSVIVGYQKHLQSKEILSYWKFQHIIGFLALQTIIWFLLLIFADFYVNFAKQKIEIKHFLRYNESIQQRKNTEIERQEMKNYSLIVKNLYKKWNTTLSKLKKLLQKCKRETIRDDRDQVESKKCFLRNVNLEIKKDTIVGLFGRNGTGKSSLFNILTGQLSKSQGQIYYSGKQLNKQNWNDISRLSVFTQEEYLEPELTVKEHFKYFIKLRGLNYQDLTVLIQKFINYFDLTVIVDMPIKCLSNSEKKLVKIILAVIGKPTLILMDEPTISLDERHKKQFWAMMKMVTQITHAGVLITTHDLTEGETYCDEVAFLFKKNSQSRFKFLKSYRNMMRNSVYRDAKKRETIIVFKPGQQDRVQTIKRTLDQFMQNRTNDLHQNRVIPYIHLQDTSRRSIQQIMRKIRSLQDIKNFKIYVGRLHQIHVFLVQNSPTQQQ